MKAQLSSEVIQAAVKLCKESVPDQILRTHVVLKFCILYRVTLWICWCLFVLIMSYIILLTRISSKFPPTPNYEGGQNCQ